MATIDRFVFCDRSGLTRLEIPESARILGEGAFWGLFRL
jgi:hypothetical protein